ncbi:MAG TPA: F0F1 ATP synthase subunit delta [Candidatus Paceibacterota bacterium]
MRASSYAQAFHELTTSRKIEEGALVKQFVAIVAGNGHAHLLPKIVRSLERTLRREEKKETIEVTSAKELSTGDVTELLKREPFKHALSPLHKKVVRKTDPTLVGGTIVRTGALRIDASYKRSLLELYRHVTEEL